MVGCIKVRLLLVTGNACYHNFRDHHPWLTEFQEKMADYTFHEDNPLLDVSDPLAEGLRKRAEGDLPSAVLLFEAEVQARPDSVQGWLYLGSTQADNEQDLPAIAALHKLVSVSLFLSN